ncbi:hypothetical protein [Streptomyces sp. NPDC051561]|uniref:hypothetical protein n=1 Tax=Streptomyces sp. NPDC051561 TaxID=3365658 RepID=UPI00379E3764
MRNHKLAVTFASGFAGLALFAAGCSGGSAGSGGSDGSGGSGGGQESSASAGGSGGGADDGSASAADKDQALRKCLRGKGIDIPDLPPGTDPRSQTLGPPEGTAPDKWKKGLEDCGASPQGGGGGDASADQQALEQRIKINKCLRGKGFDMPDPKPAKGGAVEGFGVPKGADQEKFMKALNECVA